MTQALDLGVQALLSGRWAAVEDICRRVLVVDEAQPRAHSLLGLAAHYQGRYAEAVERFDRAIGLSPYRAEYHSNKGLALHGAGRLEEAVVAHRKALACDPANGVTLNNLGFALCDLGQPEAALAPLREAIRLRPDYASAHHNHGIALQQMGRLGEGVAAFRDALRGEPENPQLLHNLGGALLDQGDVHGGIAILRKGVQLQPGSPATHSNLLIALHYHPRTTLRELFEEHRAFDRQHAESLRDGWTPPLRPPGEGGRRLRVGFISPHFARHPVGRFLIRPLDHVDRTQFQIVCYSDTRRPDAMTDRIRAAADEWQETTLLTSAQLTERIRADGIDILFDLAGHTPGHRLGVFAKRAAPIQISWLDYVGTTGLTAMDYLLADAQEVPPGAEQWYQEKVLRMPHDYVCFDPPEDAPAVNALPAIASGQVTFGSFNILPKTTPEIVAVWARILQRVPDSRMALMNHGLEDEPTAERYRAIFASHGIERQRLVLRGRCPPGEVLGRYHEIDIALDTHPYNGGLSTCEALWMGVPVITCPGETFCSRHGLTHLSAAGWTEGIARDLEDYVERAVSLASDLPQLETLREQLRAKVDRSPLCDGRRFASDLAEILRKIWRELAAAPAA